MKDELFHPLTPTEEHEGLLLADGYEGAFIGTTYCKQAGGTLAVYDRRECIRILVKRDGMSYIEAEEFFEYNTEGAYMGDLTPLFIERNTLLNVLEEY